MSDTLAAGSAAMSKEEKKRLKQEKREKKERESRDVEVPVAENKAEESQEERRARKEAKKAAKAAAKEVSGEVSAGKEDVGATGESKSEKKEKRKTKGKDKEESKQEVAETSDTALVSGGAEVQADKSEGEVTSKKDKKEKKDKKDKKRKRDEDGVRPEESSTATVEGAAGGPVAVEEQAKKKKKDKKGKGTATSEGGKAEKGESSGVFADESLSEQAQKALHYVEEHATHHLGTTAVAPGKGWKFNKARQNWLLRHIWSETEVPDKYVEGVMRYLNTMKGAGRAELLNTAKKYAAAQEPSAETSKEGGEDGDATAEVAGDEAKADGADGMQEGQDAGDAGIDWEARKQRAERMLGVMESA